MDGGVVEDDEMSESAPGRLWQRIELRMCGWDEVCRINEKSTIT